MTWYIKKQSDIMLKLHNGNCIIFLHYFSLKCEIRNTVFQYFNNVYSFTGKKKERKKYYFAQCFQGRWFCVSVRVWEDHSRAGQTTAPFLNDCHWLDCQTECLKIKLNVCFLFSYLNLSKSSSGKTVLKDQSSFLCLYLVIFSCRITAEFLP